MRTVPETDKRQDWPRLVAQTVNEQSKRINAVPSRAKLRFVA